MPIHREAGFFWTHTLGIASSLGIESARIEECVAEARARRVGGVFGHRSFGFVQADLDFLARLPWLVQVWFWDIELHNIDGLYELSGLQHFGIHPKRAPVNFARFPLLTTMVWIHEARDSGVAEAASVRHVDLWHFKPRSKHFSALTLPPNLEHLEINWANPSELTGIAELPHLKHLEIHRCRNLRSLNGLPAIAPNLEKLVITTSGKLTDHRAVAAMTHLQFAQVDGRDLLRGAV